MRLHGQTIKLAKREDSGQKYAKGKKKKLFSTQNELSGSLSIRNTTPAPQRRKVVLDLKERLVKIWCAIRSEENQSVNNREQKSPKAHPKS